MQESRYRLEPDDQARTLKRGQRKHLSEATGAMQEQDVAMWNNLDKKAAQDDEILEVSFGAVCRMCCAQTDGTGNEI